MHWNELRDIVCAKRTVLSDDGERLMLVHRYVTDDSSTVQNQRVEVSRDRVTGEPWVLLLADVCPVHEISAHRALLHNGTLAVGSIYIDEDFYFLRHAMPLETLTEHHLTLAIELLGHEATRLRARRPLAAVTDHEAFGPYAE